MALTWFVLGAPIQLANRYGVEEDKYILDGLLAKGITASKLSFDACMILNSEDIRHVTKYFASSAFSITDEGSNDEP